MEYWEILLMIISGVCIALICMIVGAWITFKAKSVPGSGQGFLRDPKGDAFTIPDEALDEAGFPGSEEPNANETRILEKTQKFLNRIGGSDGR